MKRALGVLITPIRALGYLLPYGYVENTVKQNVSIENMSGSTTFISIARPTLC